MLIGVIAKNNRKCCTKCHIHKKSKCRNCSTLVMYFVPLQYHSFLVFYLFIFIHFYFFLSNSSRYFINMLLGCPGKFVQLVLKAHLSTVAFLVCWILALENGSQLKLMEEYYYPQMMSFYQKIFAIGARQKITIFLSPTRKFLILSVVSYS